MILKLTPTFFLKIFGDHSLLHHTFLVNGERIQFQANIVFVKNYTIGTVVLISNHLTVFYDHQFLNVFPKIDNHPSFVLKIFELNNNLYRK